MALIPLHDLILAYLLYQITVSLVLHLQLLTIFQRHYDTSCFHLFYYILPSGRNVSSSTSLPADSHMSLETMTFLKASLTAREIVICLLTALLNLSSLNVPVHSTYFTELY